MADVAGYAHPGADPEKGWSGILHPSMTNKFRLRFDGSKRFDLITMQTTKVEISARDRTMRVWIQNPVAYAQDLLDLIEKLGHGKHSGRIEGLDGDEGVTLMFKFFAELEDHKLVFDYAIGEPLTHELVFKYTRAY